LWLATAGLIYRPSGFQTPLLLPALGMAALMAWIQAVSWLPLPNSWLRDTATIAILGALAALPLWLAYSELTSPTVVAVLLVGYSALAYPLGLMAVESDRRGEVWQIWPASIRRKGNASTSMLGARRRPFRSAGEAQFWYEWTCHGLALPGAVGLVLLTIMAMLIHIALMAHRPSNPILFPILLTVLILLPVVMAGSSGPGIGRMAPMFSVKSRRFLTFAAIRPMTSGGLVSAKFRMAIATVLLTWILVVVIGALLMVTAGNALGFAAAARAFFRTNANSRGFAVLVLGAVLLPALTWKQLTGGFASALSGRRWIADGVVFAYLPILGGLVAAGAWLVNHPEDLPRVFAILPYVVVSVTVLKGVVAISIFRLALHRGLITWSTVGSVLVIWLALFACGFACVLLMPSTSSLAISTPIKILSILAFMPLSRFALATVAFDWNRHR
jgi:hypothetical protein